MLEILNVLNYIFLVYVTVYATILLVSGVYSSNKMYKKAKLNRFNNRIRNKNQVPISVIVPAYNEEITIIDSVKLLLKQRYNNFEIVIVDDGSKDTTKEKVLKEFKLKKYNKVFDYKVKCEKMNEYYTGVVDGVRIKMVSKDNGKYKADANNGGINLCSNKYVLVTDADSILQFDALEKINNEFIQDELVVAVGGNISISNNTIFKGARPFKTKKSKNILASTQEIEYARSFTNTRVFFNKFNCNLICSGAFGVFEREALISVGGYDKNALGEDMELTLRLHKYYSDKKIPYKIKHAENSICWTQAPESVKDFRKQRQRWHCGLMQIMFKYKSMILNPKYKAVGLFALPYTLFYELLAPVFIIGGIATMALSYKLGMLNINMLKLTTLVYLSYGIVLSVNSHLNKIYLNNSVLGKRGIFKLVFIALVDLIFVRGILIVYNFIGYFLLSKLKKGWHSPKRVANNVL